MSTLSPSGVQRTSADNSSDDQHPSALRRLALAPLRAARAYRRVLALVLQVIVAIAVIGPNTASAPPPPPPHAATTVAANPALLVSRYSIENLPMSGAAWLQVKSWADAAVGTPDIANQDDQTELHVLAKALVYDRTGLTSYRASAISLIKDAIGTEVGGRTLALGRNLPAYVISADLVGLSEVDPAFDSLRFRPWLRAVLTEPMTEGRNLVYTDEHRPNNWGTHAGAARVAIAAYLGDTAELNRAAAVFHGWLGDESAYVGFSFGDLSWQCDTSHPVGIDPLGCSRAGIELDGALPDDMRRGGTLQWPPIYTGYPWEALQGAMLEAALLSAAGFDAWHWEDNALLRAVRFLYDRAKWPAVGDDEWQTWLIDAHYGTSYRVASPAHVGKNFGFTDWLFSNLSAPDTTTAGGSTGTSGGTTGTSGGTTGTSGGTTSTSTAPVAKAPSTRLVATSSVSLTTIPTVASWGVASTSAGVSRYAVAMSTDGGTWTSLALATATSTSTRLSLVPGHRYRLRVKVEDTKGRWSSAAYGDTFQPAESQETSGTYSASWIVASSSLYLGTHARATEAAGSRVSFSFTGRSVAWVGPTGPTRGRATVYLDGKQVTVIDLYSAAFSARHVLVALSTTEGTHQVTIVGQGTSGRPWVAVDAFFVLRSV